MGVIFWIISAGLMIAVFYFSRSENTVKSLILFYLINVLLGLMLLLISIPQIFWIHLLLVSLIVISLYIFHHFYSRSIQEKVDSFRKGIALLVSGGFFILLLSFFLNRKIYIFVEAQRIPVKAGSTSAEKATLFLFLITLMGILVIYLLITRFNRDDDEG